MDLVKFLAQLPDDYKDLFFARLKETNDVNQIVKEIVSALVIFDPEIAKQIQSQIKQGDK